MLGCLMACLLGQNKAYLSDTLRVLILICLNVVHSSSSKVLVASYGRPSKRQSTVNANAGEQNASLDLSIISQSLMGEIVCLLKIRQIACIQDCVKESERVV